MANDRSEYAAVVILRRTQKLARSLAATDGAPEASDTALGDWYVNRVVVHRRPLLLLVSSRSLLPILVPARNVADLPRRLPELVRSRLERIQVPRDLVTAEAEAMMPVAVKKTVDRAVLGILVDFAKALPDYLEHLNADADALRYGEEQLEQTPCFAGRRFEDVVFPREKTLALLRDRWAAAQRWGGAVGRAVQFCRAWKRFVSLGY